MRPIGTSIALPVQWKQLACTRDAGGDSSKSGETCPGMIRLPLSERGSLLFQAPSLAEARSPARR